MRFKAIPPKDVKAVRESTAKMSDDELETMYYDAVYDSLGSQADMMEELCFDELDIEERRKYEKYLHEYSQLLERLCVERGIELWK